MAYENGGWYDGKQYWNGSFGDTGQIINPNQQGSSPIGGSSDGGGDNSVDGILNNAISALSGLFPKPVKPYDEVNPFSFDEQLAREASTAEYSPYYDEMLTDYTTGTTRTLARSQEDLGKTIEQLQKGREYYTGTERRLLEKSLRSTNEGYAGRGLFFSGARGRDINEIQTQYGADQANYQNQYDYNTNRANTLAQRTKDDTNLSQSMYTRDIGREKKLGIEQGVLQRKTEARSQYEIGREKYYDNSLYGGMG